MLLTERGYATVSRPSVRLWRSGTCFTYRLEYFENNFTADYLKVSARANPNIGDLIQREHLQNSAGIGVGSWAENLQYLWNGARQDQRYYDGLIGSHIHAFDSYQNQ